MLPDLVELSAAGNQLDGLPSALGRLEGLQRLGLAGNRLRALPDELCRLSDLEGLWVHGNMLQAVPDNIGARGMHCCNTCCTGQPRCVWHALLYNLLYRTT